MLGEEHMLKYRSKGEKAGPKLGAGATKIKRHTPSPLGAYSLVGKADQYKAILIMSGQGNHYFWVTPRDNMSFPGQCPVQPDCNGELVGKTIHLQIRRSPGLTGAMKLTLGH